MLSLISQTASWQGDKGLIIEYCKAVTAINSDLGQRHKDMSQQEIAKLGVIDVEHVT